MHGGYRRFWLVAAMTLEIAISIALLRPVMAVAAELEVQLGEPVVVAVASRSEGWGFFQFPNISHGADRELHVAWQMCDDSIESYGINGGASAAVSSDGGKTWGPPAVSSDGGKTYPELSGLLLPNGDRISILTPKPLRCEDLNLPPSVGTAHSTYLKTPIPLYRLDQLPAELHGIQLTRLANGASKPLPEVAELDDPQALRYTLSNLFPIVWWGDMHVTPDGSVLAGIYPGYRLRDDGTPDLKQGTFFYRSTDNGHSWHIQGRIPYQPDLTADPKGDLREGFTEPAFDILPNGSCLCIMRTTDGVGIGPMYASTSLDMGKTWTRPEAIAPSGVLPRLLCLANGVMVLSSGRPGVQLRFCVDGKGKTWSKAFEMLPFEDQNDDSEQVYQGSCGYTGLLATGPDRFIIVYSDFKYKNSEGQERKAIKTREVIVM